ncbi:MAG: carbon-nitrogen hydrolase family protein [Rhodomicrobium sp.]
MADTKNKFRIGLVQMRTGKDVQENLAQADAFIREAAGRGAQYIQTPENTLVMEADAPRLLEKIYPEEKTEGVPHFSRLARELGIWLHIGSLAVKVGNGRAANRAFLFAPDGNAVCRYDKIHMFDVDLPSGETYRESATFMPGARAFVALLPWGGLGIATCYDIRFPEQYQALARAGAKFLTAPSAFTKVTGEAHWHILLRARAIENGCFMFAAAQGGRHANGRTTFGHSLVISPWGEILAEAGTEPGVIVTAIDAGEVDRVRARIPALSHTREFKVDVVPLPQFALEAAR